MRILCGELQHSYSALGFKLYLWSWLLMTANEIRKLFLPICNHCVKTKKMFQLCMTSSNTRQLTKCNLYSWKRIIRNKNTK
jgi:hypothetical protein